LSANVCRTTAIFDVIACKATNAGVMVNFGARERALLGASGGSAAISHFD
jgi:hypothetical protein